MKQLRIRNALSGILILGVIASGVAPAQVMGRLAGSVADASGAVVPGASVTVRFADGDRTVLVATTTGYGLFRFTAVRPGLYDLTIEAHGFRGVTLRGIKVDPERETALPTIRLDLQPQTEAVEVKGQPASLEASSAEISATVATEQVRRLPVGSRSATALLYTQAGVSFNGRGIVIDGQRASFTYATLDGIMVGDAFYRSGATSYFGGPNFLVLDQVAELTVATSNSNSTIGGGASRLTLVTPSGTNQLHGSGYWYSQNSALAANTWFNNRDGIRSPFSNQNQVGGSLGGPIFRDKLFFYTNYEAFRLRTHPTANRTILTEDARQGIFTYQDLQGSVRKVNVLQAAGVPMDPMIQQMLQAVPGAEKINNFRLGDSNESLLRNTAGYSFPVSFSGVRDNATGKLDYFRSPKNVFAGSYLWNRNNQDLLSGSDGYAPEPSAFQQSGRNLVSASWRWNPKPSFTQEVRGGFNRGPSNFETRQQPGEYILAGMIFSSPVDLRQPSGLNEGTFHFADNAGYVRGKHHLQFGFQAQLVRTEPFDASGTIPTYSLGIGVANAGLTTAQLPGIRPSDLGAANNLLSTLAGYVTAYSQRFNAASPTSGFVSGTAQRRHFSLDNYALYAQDNWRLFRQLALTLGLRYDYYTPVDERDSMVLLPRVANNNPIATILSNAVLDFAGSSVGRPLYRSDRNNFAPDIGLAYDLFGNGKTALRAGYSIHFVNDENLQSVFSLADANPGLSANASAVGLTARINTGLPRIPTPPFLVPRTLQNNFRISPSSFANLPDPGLATPYMQQWTFGIQQQLRNTIFEIRYVGNHGTKLLRAVDYNQVDIHADGFLDDFQRARNNGNLARGATGIFDPNYNPSIPGSQPLQLFPRLPGGGFLNQASFRNWLDTGQAGTMAFQYQFNGLNGDFNFVPNPFAPTGTVMLSNISNSSYNALQVEVRRRIPGGLQFQGSYTFSKVLTDSGGSPSRYESFLDINNAKIERARAPFDMTHGIKGNAIYDLPLGRGQRLNFRPLERLLSGWSVSGALVWQSGAPFSVLSGRGTLSRGNQSFANTANTTLTKPQLDQLLEFRQTGSGPYFAASSIIGSDGRAVAPDGRPPFEGQVFFHPGPGTIGGLQKLMFSGPWISDLDLAVLKTARITEKHSIELRMEASDALNHAGWFVGDQSLDSPNFGRITDTGFGPRVIQLSLHYRF